MKLLAMPANARFFQSAFASLTQLTNQPTFARMAAQKQLCFLARHLQEMRQLCFRLPLLPLSIEATGGKIEKLAISMLPCDAE